LVDVATSVSGTVAVPENPVPVTVTVIFAEPSVAVLEAVRVSVLDPVPGAAILVGAKTAVTPVGNPLTARPSAELKPPSAVVANMIWRVFPRASDVD